jgi:hypothetical protein
MAFSITNNDFADPSSSLLPAAHAELADLTLATAGSTVTSATQNTGVVGLKWIRVRALLKTLGGLAAGETFVVTVQAGTGAALTTPGQVAHKSVTMLASDTYLAIDVMGWSQAGFQSYAVTLSSSGASRTSIIDVMVDAG